MAAVLMYRFSPMQHKNIESWFQTSRYGCYDEIIHVPGEPEESSKSNCSSNRRRIRRCNWPRFLSSTFEEERRRAGANLKCAKNPQNGQVVYETLENIAPNTDLVVDAVTTRTDADTTELDSVISRAIAAFMQGM